MTPPRHINDIFRVFGENIKRWSAAQTIFFYNYLYSFVYDSYDSLLFVFIVIPSNPFISLNNSVSDTHAIAKSAAGPA